MVYPIRKFLEQMVRIAQVIEGTKKTKATEIVTPSASVRTLSRLLEMRIVHIYEVSGITGVISLEVRALSRKIDALIGSDCVGRRQSLL